MPRLRFMPCAVFAYLATCATLLHAQSNASAFQASLLGKTYFLRSLCSGDNLHFSADGKPSEACVPEPFSLGLLTIDKVEENASGLKLTAHRVGLAFQNNMPQRVDLSQPVRGGKPHAVVLHLSGAPSGSFTAQLAAVLTTRFDDLLPNIPEAWQGFFQTYLLTSSSAPAPAPAPSAADTKPLTQDEIDAEQINPMIHEDPSALPGAHASGTKAIPYPWAKVGMSRIGKDGVAPPKVLKHKDALFSTQARSMGYSNKCLLKLIVDEQGLPQHPAVQIPAGLGLDEQALAAIAQYRFQPAVKDGKPVSVVLQIEVNFQMM